MKDSKQSTYVSLRAKILNPKKSIFKKYQELVIGNYSFISLLKYEVIISAFSWIPGALGLLLRKYFYKYLFKEIGANVIFGKNITILHPDKIKISKNCLVGDNCLINAEGESGGIFIGDNVEVARNTMIRSRGGIIEVGEGTGISSYCHISSIATKVKLGKNVLIASYCYIIGGGTYGFDRLDVPINAQKKPGKGIVIGDDVWLGAGVYVLDGNNIGTGSVIGAGAVVTKDIPKYSVAVGVPAKVIRKRK